jgi:spore maturation protein CgeB
MLAALAALGHAITFYEPDAYDRQNHRDIEPPDWARVRVYAAHIDAARAAMAQAARADVVVKASGVGLFDEELLHGVMEAADIGAIRIFWDVDAPATVAEMRQDPLHPVRRALPGLDLVLTYGGGPPIVRAYETLGAKRCVPVYNALDPVTHHPVAPDPAFAGALGFLGNRLPDREHRVDRFFLEGARLLPDRRFVLGGAGWGDKEVPANVRRVGHVYTRQHNAFNCTPSAVLNIARDSMADIGYSPATRVFEAAGAAACLITDFWEGIAHFLEPDAEVLVARDGRDVAEHLRTLTPARAAEIGARARARVLAEHTYTRRAAQVHRLLDDLASAKRARSAA